MSEATEQQNCDLIASFEWVDDDTPLPVDPNDPAQLQGAIKWAEKEYRRYEYESFLARNGYGYDEDDSRIIHSDKRALGLFLAALKRQYHRMAQRDRAALDAWNSQAPIRAEPVEL
jgi:hypothetical protein